jgi:hypothetical protein
LFQYIQIGEKHLIFGKDIRKILLNNNDTIEEVTRDDLVRINPTNLVKKENGKYRLVIDTRKVNCWIRKIHFK